MNSDESSAVPPRWFSLSPLPGPDDSPAPAGIVHVEFGAHSRPGPGRFANEDHYLILRLGRHQETLRTSLPASAMASRFDEFGYGMVIADGIGSDGEAASRLAITTLVHLTVSFGKWNLRIDEPIASEVMNRARRFYREVDFTLLQAGRVSELGLQSALTAVFTAGTELFFAHVGHSRAYLYRDGKLMQLTHDHTLASAQRMGKGPMLDVAASGRDHNHTLTDTLGKAYATSGLRIDIERCGLLDGDVVLLCTNGLTDMVDDARIARVLGRHATPDDQCRTLVNLAVEARGEDDATALVAHYRIPR
jgi:serine/threonine protein phosphatase PrpC